MSKGRLGLKRLGRTARGLKKADAKYISSSYTRGYDFFMDRGEGAWVWDVDGNKFLDFTSGIGVSATGYNNKNVVSAIERQARKFLHMSGSDFYYEKEIRLAQKLAALAHRDKLASRSAVCRGLADVELELLRPASEWLLSEGAGIDVLLRHPAVLTYDAQGKGWHVYHYDPTVSTLRHRALPVGKDLPAPRRRSERTAAPGYSGRKRGNVQVRRGTLQHGGSGAWLQAMLGPGNSDSHAEWQAGLAAVERTSKRIQHPLEQTLVLVDGAFSGVSYFTESRERGVSSITRLYSGWKIIR